MSTSCPGVDPSAPATPYLAVAATALFAAALVVAMAVGVLCAIKPWDPVGESPAEPIEEEG